MQQTMKKKTGLVLGGGAPNSPLIAGALAAFLDQEVEFDVISASGAGVLMGLLYAAPLEGSPREALKRWADTGVSDSIYKMMPVNYKIFHKPGQEADASATPSRHRTAIRCLVRCKTYLPKARC